MKLEDIRQAIVVHDIPAMRQRPMVKARTRVSVIPSERGWETFVVIAASDPVICGNLVVAEDLCFLSPLELLAEAAE